MTPLVSVRDLSVQYPLRRRGLGVVRAVDGVSFDICRGETLGLVGESGCGKSTTGRAILQLIRPTSGRVEFDGEDLGRHWQMKLGRWRWSEPLRVLRRRMQVVFQDGAESLDPRMTIAAAISEPLSAFGVDASFGALAALVSRVGLEAKMLHRYPHELSGGQQQRVAIARALALEPDFIVADEPVSALDASIRAQILNLMVDLQRESRLTYLFIAHDLASVRYVSHRVAVMYLGRIVELGEAEAVFERPMHPYTRLLLSASEGPAVRRELPVLCESTSPMRPLSGCAFFARCPDRIERCRAEAPAPQTLASGTTVACHLAE